MPRAFLFLTVALSACASTGTTTSPAAASAPSTAPITATEIALDAVSSVTYVQGDGLAPMRVPRRVSVEALSPTVAQLLGVSLPAGEAGLLTEALPPKAR